MAIVLRTFAADQNTTTGGPFVSIAVPVGVRDGDLLIAMVTVEAGDTVTAPPGWTLIRRTDPAQFGVAAFYKTAMSEQDRWVFPNGSGVGSGSGGVVVYGGVDSFQPFEASVAATTAAASANLAIAATATSVPSEEVVLLLGVPSNVTFTPATGYLKVASKADSRSVAIHRKNYADAGAIGAFTVASSAAHGGASLALVLRPSVGTVSVDQARARLLSGLPAGADQTYDLESGGDYYYYFQSIAEVLKAFCFDLVDLLRSEIVPSKSLYKLPDWEQLFGLSTRRTTKVGTVPQRQAQIQSAWRAAAGQGSSSPEVQSVIGPLLGYFATTAVEIINADRAALKTAHSYGPSSNVTVAASSTTTISIYVPDYGTVSAGGAHLALNFTSADLTGYTIELDSADGLTTKTWADNWTSGPIELFGAEFIGKPSRGSWTLKITNPNGVSNTLSAGGLLFVEAISPKQQTAGASSFWGVYADPAHLGESGVPADIDAAYDALQRLKQAHETADIILSKTPYPDTTSGSHAAIPGRCIPV
jgi:hypothetical protein